MLGPARGMERPRVRGLGLVQGAFVVTLPHIAEVATVAELPGDNAELAVRPLTMEGGLALMELSPHSRIPVHFGEAKGPVAVATVGDITPTVSILEGVVDQPETGERFTIALEQPLGEDYTVAGSPVVAGDRVVGIAGPRASTYSVDAFGHEAIERLLSRYIAGPAPPTPLSATTMRALSVALQLPYSPSTAVLLGVLHSGGEDKRATVPAQLLERLGGKRLLRDINRLVGPSPSMTETEFRDSSLGPVIEAAERVRERVGEDGLHRRHLLAAVLVDPPELPREVVELLGTPLPEIRRHLHDIIASVYDPHDEWDRIFGPPEPAFDLAGGVSADLVDPTTGIPLEEDHLGLSVEVTMLAALIADTKTPMPLSIGLFGEWGSGKSYFMALLRAEIDRLSKSSDPRYRSEIVQIGFNAWHYADSNLWASLGDEIFEQLAGPQAQTTEDLRDALRSDLDERLQRRAELKAATERAEAETKRLTTHLEQAAAKRRTSARELATAVLADEELRAEIDPALDKLGVKDEAEQIQLLASELEQAPEDVATVRPSVSRPPVGWVVAAVALAGAAIAVGIAFSHELAGVAAAALTVLAAAGGIAARLRSGLGVLHRVADRVRRTREEDVAEKLTALRQAETAERMLQAQLDEVIRQVGELSRELAELTPGQRLYRFVAERAASETYRGQLGLISTIRKDFEQLNALMKEWRDGGGEKGRRPIDRIVLYIDDLDRCSPQQVVQVLQAVHLLLALDLFVVVVGVDPRWLLHSLRREYRSLLTTETTARDDGRWESTPQDYLEKIFNIPFALPRMTTASFGQLVGSFVETEDEEHEEAPPPPRIEGSSLVVTREDGEETRLDIGELEAVAEQRSEVAELHAGAATVERRPLTAEELKMLTELAPLVETPRETKRLVNLYRMMRSTRDLSPAARFLGAEGTPGEYQAVVILLGLLSGHARLLHDVLLAPAGDDVRGGLRGRPPGETWQAFAQGLKPRATDGGVRNDVIGDIPPADVEEWKRLAEGLEDASALVTLPDLKAFQAWAPRIARFSFLLAPYTEQSDKSRAA